MSLLRRFVANDEELGKKDDDHRAAGRTGMASPIVTNFSWRGPRRKRILIAISAFLILFVFFRNIPKDAIPATHRHAARPFPPGSPQYVPAGPKGPPPRSESPDNKHYFEGPIKYYNLAASFAAERGPVYDNRNVLFVASNLQSAASILPLACNMSKQNKNRVHFMLTGRDNMAIQDMEMINGVTEADCSIRWHDGRPDYSMYSTDYRMEVSARASLYHITSFMKPKVVLIEEPGREDSFFSKGIKDKAVELNIPLIELPIRAAEQVSWISKLDASSLRAWNDVTIEILIHSPPESSGSLIRLLKSLEKADYFGFQLPRLTIELPNKIDPPIMQYLSDFRWPPQSHTGNSRLTLRHRLFSTQLDAHQASIRQIESFYPSNVPQSHILVLSPQVELSPLYFQYLVNILLNYKYSTTASNTPDSLMGISLETPSTTLNGKDHLSISEEASTQSLFLYQAPNSNAALYFGDKWVELHSFLSNRFAVDKDLQQKPSDAPYSISETYPSWLGYVLELARARAYTMLYPSFALSSEDAFATIHTELYHSPEEYPKPITQLPPPPLNPDIPLTVSSESSFLESAAESTSLTTSSTHSLLHLLHPLRSRPTSPSSHLENSDSSLPDLSTLPLLSHTGQHLTQGQVSLNQAALLYTAAFAKELGGCTATESGGGDNPDENTRERKTRPERKAWSADDLFCLEVGEVEGVITGVGHRPRTGEESDVDAQPHADLDVDSDSAPRESADMGAEGGEAAAAVNE